MKKSLLLAILLLYSGLIFAQQYPLVTLQDIQFVPDSIILLGQDPPSPLNGDTVEVKGCVLVAPLVNPSSDRRPIISAGSRWVTYIEDENGNVWGGLNILQEDTSAETGQATFFDIIDTAQVVKFTGVVDEYFTTTQMLQLVTPTTPISIESTLPKRPDPIELQVSDFDDGGLYNYASEKYEGMYVILRNVITSDRNTSSGVFNIHDADGNTMHMYDQSGYFTLRYYRLSDLTDYQPPDDGSILSYIRGVINSRADGYYIVPMYPGDIGPVVKSPPVITNVRRNSGEVAPNQAVEISAKIKDLPPGNVVESRLYYRVDGGQRMMLPMTLNLTDTTYRATIPGVNSDSAVVDFYVWSVDDDTLVSTNPIDTVHDNYFYIVLNRPVNIRDVQYSPFGGGYSGYTNYEVTLQGIVTSDTSDIKGYGSTSFLRNYIQDGTGPWSGIEFSFGGSLGTEVEKLYRGDLVTLTGTIQESYGVTLINNITDYNVISTNNILPEPQVLTTGEIGLFGDGEVDKEKWESVLVEYDDVTITNINADGGSNYGEMLVSDGSGDTRVELEDGDNSYHNGSGEPGTIEVQDGNTFQKLKGIMYYSFSNYKLVPRNDNDFVGYSTAVRDEHSSPVSFDLKQNYPNPFNPSTKIVYSIPKESNVKLKIFNILGQQVKVLVNQAQPQGTYTVTFDAASLPSGIYFYSIETGSYNEVKKMILLK